MPGNDNSHRVSIEMVSYRKIRFHWKISNVAAYRATNDVPRDLAQVTARMLVAEWRRHGVPRGSRAVTCSWRAALGM